MTIIIAQLRKAIQTNNPMLIQPSLAEGANVAIKIATASIRKVRDTIDTSVAAISLIPDKRIADKLMPALQSQADSNRKILDTEFVPDGPTCAVKIASLLIDSNTENKKKILWGKVLLDMLIIGCNYQIRNPEDNKYIINYLTEFNSPEWQNIIAKMRKNETLSIVNDLLPLKPKSTAINENSEEAAEDFKSKMLQSGAPSTAKLSAATTQFSGTTEPTAISPATTQFFSQNTQAASSAPQRAPESPAKDEAERKPLLQKPTQQDQTDKNRESEQDNKCACRIC